MPLNAPSNASADMGWAITVKLVATGHSDHPGHRERREGGKERGREKEGLLREA